MSIQIKAFLKKPISVTARIENTDRLSASIKRAPQLSAQISSGFKGENIPIYDNSYTVQPAPFKAQELQTKDKRMVENLTVLEIPYYDVSNDSGNTIFIGSEVNFNGN